MAPKRVLPPCADCALSFDHGCPCEGDIPAGSDCGAFEEATVPVGAVVIVCAACGWSLPQVRRTDEAGEVHYHVGACPECHRRAESARLEAVLATATECYRRARCSNG